jgi:hypothetical protein
MARIQKIIVVLSITLGGIFITQAQEIPELPTDVREMVPEKDLLEVFCLMTKYKSGEFFATVDALEEVLAPALEELRNIGLEAEIPDIANYKNQGQEKLTAICQAQTWKEAQAAANDFINFGESVRTKLQGLNASLGQDLKTKGEELKSKIETKIENEISSWVEQEKVKIQNEIENGASTYAESLRIKLENDIQNMSFDSEAEAQAYANNRAQQIKSQVEQWVKNEVEKKKTEMEARVNSEVLEIIGMPVENFKLIGEKMGNIEETIQKIAAEKTKQYEQYKLEALAKRKQIIITILDQKISQAEDLIKSKESLLTEAKLNDPTVKTASEYIAELQSDKEVLAGKIEAAVDKNDEAAMNLAIEEMNQKWDNLRSKLEADLAKKQNPQEVCSSVLPQISQAKPQMEDGLNQIQLGQEEINSKKQECEGISEPMPICEKANALYNQLSKAKEKTQVLLNQMRVIETQCVEAAEWNEEFLKEMLDLKNQGPQWQEEIINLKNQWLTDKKELEKELLELTKIKK